MNYREVYGLLKEIMLAKVRNGSAFSTWPAGTQAPPRQCCRGTVDQPLSWHRSFAPLARSCGGDVDVTALQGRSLLPQLRRGARRVERAGRRCVDWNVAPSPSVAQTAVHGGCPLGSGQFRRVSYLGADAPRWRGSGWLARPIFDIPTAVGGIEQRRVCGHGESTCSRPIFLRPPKIGRRWVFGQDFVRPRKSMRCQTGWGGCSNSRTEGELGGWRVRSVGGRATILAGLLPL